MEWWVCTGFEVAALPKLLETESAERQSLRESIYRVFGRYRYHLTARRTEELDPGACLDPETIAGDKHDFVMDLDAWLEKLPTLEAKIIDLYYFQHKTMEEIGEELGLAKQRISGDLLPGSSPGIRGNWAIFTTEVHRGHRKQPPHGMRRQAEVSKMQESRKTRNQRGLTWI